MGYSEKDIVIIEDDVEKIKQSHTMYIGYYGWHAMLHLIKEVIQNSIDESTNKESPCDEIMVDYEERTKVMTIADNGRGIPLGSIVKVCTYIQSSGKFNKGESSAYNMAAGMHGVGLTAVNALSTKCTVVVYREGIKKTVVFEFGHLVSEKEEKCAKSKTGTLVSFIPNEEILKKVKSDYKQLLDLCQTLSYLSKVKMLCHVTTKNGKDINEKYVAKNGIRDLINRLCPERLINPVYIQHDQGDKRVEIAFTYAPNSQCSLDNNGQAVILSYVNYCTTIEQGCHVTGFNQGLSNALSKYVKEEILNKREKDKINIIADDIRTGLVVVINVFHVHASFVGQMKEKNNNEDLIPYVRQATQSGLQKWIKENDKHAKKIGEWIRDMAKVRIKSSQERKAVIKEKGFDNAFSKDQIKNLKRANGKGPKELIIVEGDSAGGSGDQCRNKKYQELFYLRGVIRNIYGLSINQALENAEIRGLVTCIGTNIGKKFDITKCRYERIIIATDADIDGHKITSLLCVLFSLMFPGLVEAGIIYKAVPPLYKITNKGKELYLKDNKEYAAYIQNLISNNMTIYRKEGKDDVKLSKKEVVDLIVRTRKYVRDLNKLSSDASVPQLLELIALHLDDLYENKFKKFEKDLNKLYPFMKLIDEENGSYVIEGLINKEFQYVRLTERTFNKLKPIYDHLKEEENGCISYKVDNKQIRLFDLLKIFESYEPAHKQRFKGLGEMMPTQLWETTLDPERRTLIQLTTDNLEKDLAVLNILHGRKEESRNERKSIMSKFKIDLDDIDN